MNSVPIPHTIRILSALLCLGGLALAQGTPSGEYGQIAMGQTISGVMVPATNEQIVYHTYVVTVPPGTQSLVIAVSGDGADLDLAVKFGAPIVDYNDVDHLDTSEVIDPSYTITNPPAGEIYIDVLNLIPQAASYRLSVTAGAPAATPTAPAPQNPLGGGRPNPFSPTTNTPDPFVGTFEGEGLQVAVTGGGGSYQGEMILSGQIFPFVASGGGEVMQGTFDSGGGQFPFVGTLQGGTLIIESGGTLYRTVRVGDAAPAPAPANPLGGGTPPADDPVIAQGAYGTLTQDNALAFVEALEFSLQQVGYTYTFSDADRQQLLQALVQNYAQGQPSDQAVLAQARQVWTQVQNNWAAASETDRQEFIIGVFVIAFGPEAVQQAMATGGGGGNGSTGCGDIDTCISTYSDPEAFQDTMNAQSCWAAAGCDSYDPSTNDFYYEEPVFDVPTDY